MTRLQHGIRANFTQFMHQLLQVLLVGLSLGMVRTVVPALAESEFGVAANSFLVLTSFVVAFGLVKGTLNFVAGRLSESMGRKRVLLLGWMAALPVPIMIHYAPDWNWIVAATVLLGVNQGLTWSMTQTAKLDITRADQRGFTIGLNEFAGYVGVALGGILTGYGAVLLSPRNGLLVFGLATVLTGLMLTCIWVQDTLPWAKAQSGDLFPSGSESFPARYPKNVSVTPGTWELFALLTWRDRRLAAICQAGLVEKFVDSLVWVVLPVFLYNQGTPLTEIGWITGIYALVWGASQFVTGKLSDHVGRHWMNISGMWICGAGVILLVLGQGNVWWSWSAAITGLGMALLYPNLSAAVADISAPGWRGSAIGIYRFWRDMGYAVGALGMGLSMRYLGSLQAAFWFVSIAMFLSGFLLWWLGEETHPAINPAPMNGI